MQNITTDQKVIPNTKEGIFLLIKRIKTIKTELKYTKIVERRGFAGRNEEFKLKNTANRKRITDNMYVLVINFLDKIIFPNFTFEM